MTTAGQKHHAVACLTRARWRYRINQLPMDDATTSDALALRNIIGLGETYVANRPIAAGELLLREAPTLIASPLQTLDQETRATYEAGASELMLELDDLLIVHAFARAGAATRTAALAHCCGAEVCPEDHELIVSAKATAIWCKANDAECAALALGDLEQVVMIFALNAFGRLADGLTNGATSLYCRSAKFTHRCVKPSVVFHGQDGTLNFRATRAIASGEIPTISYLGAAAHASAPRRRRLLYQSKAFMCTCDDCIAQPDLYRQLPCPRCGPPREPASGLLPSHGVRCAEASAQDGTLAWSAPPLISRHPLQVSAHGIVSAPSIGTPPESAAGRLAHPQASEDSLHATPSGETFSLEGVWRCPKCMAELSDDNVAVACAPPQAGTRAWPLQLPPGTLLDWERALEEAVHNMSRLQQESLSPPCASTRAGPRAYTGAVAATLQRLPTLIEAVDAVVGPAHWTSQALHEMQLDHWLEIAALHQPRATRTRASAPTTSNTAPDSAADPLPPAEIEATAALRAERRLRAALELEAGTRFSSTHAFMQAVWASTSRLWALRLERGIDELWDSVAEALQTLEAWGSLRALLGGDSAQCKAHWAQAMAMVSAMRKCTQLEYGVDSDDASVLRRLEARTRQLQEGAACEPHKPQDLAAHEGPEQALIL